MSERDNSNSSTQRHHTQTLSPGLADERGERWAFYIFTLFLLLLFATAIWLLFDEERPDREQSSESSAASSDGAISREPLLPLPQSVNLDTRKVALGRELFFDPRLSKDDTISCSSCHDLQMGGGDGKRVATGTGGAEGEVNTLSVFNTAYQIAWFWDGRATSLADQIDGPIYNPKEMAIGWPELVQKLKRLKEYQTRFNALYPNGITEENIKDAIVNFEKSLITPNSRFDRYLHGEDSAIDTNEKRGYRLFKEYGCVACHQGMNIGGNMFQIFGVAKNYFEKRGNITKADLGRFNVTGKEEDRHRFRVPSLRNVALTAPYFHDGSAPTLPEAVKIMAEYQLGRAIPDQDIAAIVAFLHTLSGEYPHEGPQ